MQPPPQLPRDRDRRRGGDRAGQPAMPRRCAGAWRSLRQRAVGLLAAGLASSPPDCPGEPEQLRIGDRNGAQRAVADQRCRRSSGILAWVPRSGRGSAGGLSRNIAWGNTRRRKASMYKHILVPSDGSRLSQKAAAQAIALAKVMRARVTGFHASPLFPLPVYASGVVFEPLTAGAIRGAVRAGGGAPARRHRAQGPGCARRLQRGARVRRVRPGRRSSPRRSSTTATRSALPRTAAAACRRWLLGSEPRRYSTHCKLPLLVVR